MQQPVIIFFDGVCNLCNGTVNLLIDLDKREVLRFAPLQGTTYQTYQQQYPVPDDLSSIVVLHGNSWYTESSAALKIVQHLGFPWKLLTMGYLLPPFIRNALYRLVAKHRYQWFGQRDTCRIPTPELRQRFLD